jgi:hypothetical protein
VIDFEVRLTSSDHPFEHLRGSGLIAPGQVRELRDTRPALDRYVRADRSTGPARRRYRLYALEIFDESTELRPRFDEFSAPWRELIADVLSERFDEWLRTSAGFTEPYTHRSCGIYTHLDGDFQDISTGKLDKRLSISISLNPDWPSDGRGDIALWSGPTGTGKPVVRVPPLGGTCFVYSPSPTTWHGTEPVAPHRGLIRNWIGLTYHDKA